MTIIEFLTARLDELEAVARTAQEQRPAYDTYAGKKAHEEVCNLAAGEGAWGPVVDFVRLLTPEVVLADIAAKRAIIALFTPPPDHRSEAELHRARAHPGWEYATTEGPRKRWDDEDRPPEGEGWVRNVEAGDNGWERFEYTEESYWRRPRAEPRSARVEPPVLRLLAQPFADHPDFDESWKL